MRVQNNAEDIGRCGCGRRVYCDGSHGLSEAEWQAQLARERTAAPVAAAPAADAAQAESGSQ